MKKIRILFVCRYNRFRSRIAEAYFNKVNKNKNIEAKSAGLIKGNDVDEKTIKLLKKAVDIDISGKPKGLSSKIMLWQNLTVIVADDVPKKVFIKNKNFGKKVIRFKIKDSRSRNPEVKLKVARKVIKKVDSLIKKLENVK